MSVYTITITKKGEVIFHVEELTMEIATIILIGYRRYKIDGDFLNLQLNKFDNYGKLDESFSIKDLEN